MTAAMPWMGNRLINSQSNRFFRARFIVVSVAPGALSDATFAALVRAAGLKIF